MGQLWCEHITERKPSEKSIARAEELVKTMATCSLPRIAMKLLWNMAVLNMISLETVGLR